jgi:RCC1 and BTB domain-containing protein
MLTATGEVFTVGYNDNGQCGHGTTNRISTLTQVEALKGRVVTQVHAYNGCEHALVVTDDGKLLSFGYNYRGQLGHGTTASEACPRLVRGLERRRVTVVACSYYHTLVACDDGDLFSFGRNDFGQLGHGDTTDKKQPTWLEMPAASTVGVRSLAAGQYHSLVSTGDGKVYAFGKNDYGQLGLESVDSQVGVGWLACQGGGGGAAVHLVWAGHVCLSVLCLSVLCCTPIVYLCAVVDPFV